MFQGVERPYELIFCIPSFVKSDFKRNHLSDVLIRRMTLRNHNLHSGRLKNDFVEVDETMFQGVERPCDIVFCILGIKNTDLDEDA
jgi:hypothetical protein